MVRGNEMATNKKGDDSLTFDELLENYQSVVAENSNLKEEIRALKAQLGIAEQKTPVGVISAPEPESEITSQTTAPEFLPSGICKTTASSEKIRLSCRYSRVGTMCLPSGGKAKRRVRPDTHRPA